MGRITDTSDYINYNTFADADCSRKHPPSSTHLKMSRVFVWLEHVKAY